MSTTALITPLRAPTADKPRDATAPAKRSPAAEKPAIREMFEVLPMIDVVVVAGPPVVWLAGPLVPAPRPIPKAPPPPPAPPAGVGIPENRGA